KKAIELRNTDWFSHGTIGRFYFRHGRYQEAETHFLRVIELTPDNSTGYMILGGLYIAMGRPADAEKQLRASIAIKPLGDAYTNLGTLYYQLGRHTEAVGM